MNQISGYVKGLAEESVKRQSIKPFFGKSYLKFVQCYILWSYFFQLGGILGAKYNEKSDDFCNAFLGFTGEKGSINKYFSKIESRILNDFAIESMNFGQYISVKFRKKIGYTGDEEKFLLEYFKMKIPIEVALESSWFYAIDGVATGILNPKIIQTMFKNTNTFIPKEDWKIAHDSGLEIPSKQEILTYNEVTEEENESFINYCQFARPELYKILIT